MLIDRDATKVERINGDGDVWNAGDDELEHSKGLLDHFRADAISRKDCDFEPMDRI